MPKPRKAQISLDATPYYHCTSRCVRRAFLCGEDHLTGKNYEHRRGWVEERLVTVAQAFCIDLCAYAVMSNHMHVVLHVNAQEAASLDDRTVCERWHGLFKGTPLTQRLARGDVLSEAEIEAVLLKVDLWREQLQSISWFMRCVNEPIARMANAEDSCTGAFWEARFTSQALLDEKALLACLAYVDLNPVRAKMAETPEASEYTSIKVRVANVVHHRPQPSHLFPFAGNPREDMPPGLPFELTHYLELVEWTGRILRDDKRGHIRGSPPQIMQRLNFSTRQWEQLARGFERHTSLLVGEVETVKQHAALFGYRKTPPKKSASALFS